MKIDLYKDLKVVEEGTQLLTRKERLKVSIEPLCKWYEENHRSLAWRENPNPYWIWVSEIMLQQTRVEAVKAYFDRFITSLPEIKDLAMADDDTLMKLWEGLGYYSRIKNMKKAALICLEKYNGNLPTSYEELLELPGIGSYTAGAIASIAYGIRVPAVDGNVLRVISRLIRSKDDISKQSVKKGMEKELKDVMEIEQVNPRILNQALMELGATVCLPNGVPLCGACPWEHICLAKRNDEIKEIPYKAPKKPRKIEMRTVFVIVYKDVVFIKKRPDQGLLASLYEFPNVVGHWSEEETITYWEDLLQTKFKVTPIKGGKHIFSHIEWHMIGYFIELEARTKEDRIRKEAEANLMAVSLEEIQKQYSIPSAFQFFLTALEGERRA